MPRDLRPRRTRQSYTALFHSEDEEGNEPGPSQRRRPSTQQEDDSGSDFAPLAPGEAAPDDGVGDDVGAGIDSSNSDMNAPLTTSRSKKKAGNPATSQGKEKKNKRKKDATAAAAAAKAKGKQKAKVTPAPVPAAAASTATAPPTAPPATRQNHALPNPNVHHRHRPVPLFPGPTAPTVSASGSVRVERLQRAPHLFAPNETVSTNAYASTAVPLLTRRIGRAWGVGVGAGPVWELVEDLGWFREGEVEAQARAVREKTWVGGEGAEGQTLGQGQVVVCDESARRPRVHADVVLPQGWTVFRRAECVSPLPLRISAAVHRPFLFLLLMLLYQRWDRVYADGWKRRD